jgi:hypothetical protein
MASPTQASAFAVEAGERPISIRTFAGSLVLAGLANAAIVAFLIFHLPATREPTLKALCVRALLFVAGAVFAGLAGSRFYWNRSSATIRSEASLSFRHFALVNAEAWVWVPAIVLLSRQDSPNSAVLSALGAALLANGLRRALPRVTDLQNRQTSAIEFEEHEMFAATLHTPPREAHGYVIAFSLYCTGFLLIEHFYLAAGIPLALSTFLAVWKLTNGSGSVPRSVEKNTHASLRLASVAAAAIVVTLFVLLIGIGHRRRVEAANVALAERSNAGNGGKPQKPLRASAAGIGGYESVILWPAPEKKQIVAPQPASISPFATRTARPLVIHFDGSYWYFQPPDKRPGANAHQAHGSPLAVNIEANNFFPLIMEAVQGLRSTVRLARCREIQVSIENRDNVRGVISLGVVLTDRTAPGEPSLSLGLKPVVTSEPGQFSIKTSPAAEMLQFAIPEHANIRKFDEIAVLVIPDAGHFEVGPKIAIEQFDLLPR